jgi:hypothetical protein
MPVVLLLAAAFVVSGHALVRALSYRVPLLAVVGPGYAVILLFLVASLLAGLLALHYEFASQTGARPRIGAGEVFGSLLVVSVGAWLCFLAFVQPFQRLWFDFALGVSAGLWATTIADGGVLKRSPTVIRGLGRVVVILAISVVLLELLMRIVAVWIPSPLFVRVGDAPRSVLNRFRQRPGDQRFGFPFNRGGHYDLEFVRKRDGEHLVASIGDSFSIGSVPHAWHFTTVCEEGLGIPVCNLGAPGIGPPEYLRLLVDEALPLDPDIVVVCIFVGNDLTIADVEHDLPDQALRTLFQRSESLSWTVLHRLVRIQMQNTREIVSTDALSHSPSTSSPPWLTDPALETPSMSEDTYLRLEAQRAEAVCSENPASMAAFKRTMLSIQQASRERTLVVLLIPDEFQVEDPLWNSIQSRAHRPLDRDRPQNLILPWLEQHDIPCLDLLPLMRALPTGNDGMRHLYHSRDTHWNARGNRVAGEALARFLKPRVH